MAHGYTFEKIGTGLEIMAEGKEDIRGRFIKAMQNDFSWVKDEELPAAFNLAERYKKVKEQASTIEQIEEMDDEQISFMVHEIFEIYEILNREFR